MNYTIVGDNFNRILERIELFVGIHANHKICLYHQWSDLDSLNPIGKSSILLDSSNVEIDVAEYYHDISYYVHDSCIYIVLRNDCKKYELTISKGDGVYNDIGRIIIRHWHCGMKEYVYYIIDGMLD